MKKGAKKREWVGSWWARMPLSYFNPLLSFANEQIEESNWKSVLWEAMGEERLCRLTRLTNLGPTTEIAFARDIHDVTVHQEPYMPRIAGAESTLDRTREVQKRVRHVLNLLVQAAESVHLERTGQNSENSAHWSEKVKKRAAKILYPDPNGRNGTGWVEKIGLMTSEADYGNFPWVITHFQKQQEVLDAIGREFGLPETRRATVNRTGFVCFDDAGRDASITLSWVLGGLVEVVWREGRPILKRCLWCEKYFIHLTLKGKKFCSDPCRFNWHNKGGALPP